MNGTPWSFELPVKCVRRLLPETFHHIGQVHGVGNSIRLSIVKGLQFLWQQHSLKLTCHVQQSANRSCAILYYILYYYLLEVLYWSCDL